MIFGRFGLLELVVVIVLLIIVFGPRRLGKIGRELLQGFTGMQDAPGTGQKTSPDDEPAKKS